MICAVRRCKSSTLSLNFRRSGRCCPPNEPVFCLHKAVAEDATMTDPRLERIAGLLTLKAGGQYGLSDINQRQHALQAAWLAEKMGRLGALVGARPGNDHGDL